MSKAVCYKTLGGSWLWNTPFGLYCWYYSIIRYEDIGLRLVYRRNHV